MMLSKLMSKKSGGVPRKQELPNGITEEILKAGQEVEASEHTWATPEQARKIALDHLAECGAKYYEELEEMEKELKGVEEEENEDGED